MRHKFKITARGNRRGVGTFETGEDWASCRVVAPVTSPILGGGGGVSSMFCGVGMESKGLRFETHRRCL